MTRPAAGGGRWVTVAPERLSRWFEGFESRHGAYEVSRLPDQLTLRADDGTTAAVEVPFPPLPPVAAGHGNGLDDLVAHASQERRVGVLLVRLGGSACGVFDGQRLVASKVTTRQVHGRSAAGGQSQQRFARRRDNQVTAALQASAETARRVLLPEAASLAGLVVGGERTAVQAVLQDVRLAPLRPLVTGRLLDGPDPRQKVLEQSYGLFRAVWVRVVDS